MREYKTGDLVNSVACDWEFDNPMVITEEMHFCHCPCKAWGMISARGQSGKIYEEVGEAWEFVDKQ